MSDTPQSYPLSWPDGWPRTEAKSRGRSSFKHAGHEVSVAEAVARLERELGLLGVTSEVLSTNVTLTLNGARPRSSQPEVQDPGAAVYFVLDKKPIALACDKWDRVADNIVAIAKHIESLRGQDRWGVGTRGQAFTGYVRLPAPGEHARRPWWKVLGCDEPPTKEAGEAIFKRLAMEAHPDRDGGNHARMAELTEAIAEARKEWSKA